MKQLVATPDGAVERAFPQMRNVVTIATQRFEDIQNEEMRAPAMPTHLRNYLSWRGMVRYNIAVTHRQTPAYLRRNADDWRAVY